MHESLEGKTCGKMREPHPNIVYLIMTISKYEYMPIGVKMQGVV